MITTEVTNTGGTPIHEIVAHLNMADVDGSVYVDSEDWSSNHSERLSLQPSESRTVSCDLQALSAGRLAVAPYGITVIGPEEPAISLVGERRRRQPIDTDRWRCAALCTPGAAAARFDRRRRTLPDSLSRVGSMKPNQLMPLAAIRFGGREQRRPVPAVSVIISTYNAGTLLANALDALAAQSLPAHLVEILVVDDGSTDGTWRYLSELEGQRGNIKIFRQPHTGGPSAGRNRALSNATGSYVFFHDADDFLGPDALRRLVDTADREDSDIVAVRVSWIGRPNPDPGPAKSVLDADILEDGVWRSLTPHKLIRRSLIERLGLRFCEDMVQGEDQVFMASCLFAARKISVLGDKDLYHRRMLPDGSNLSRQQQSLSNKRLTTARMVGLVVANTTPGLRRDRLLRRIFVRTLPPALNRPFMAAVPDERKEFLDVMQAEVFPYLPRSVLGELEDRRRLRLLTAKIGTPEDLVELNRVLSATVKYGDGELPTYTLGPHLDRLLSAEDRQVGAPRLAATPILCEVAASPNQVTIRVSLEDVGASAGRLSLAAWHRGSPDFVDLGPVVARAGSTLTFTISAGQLEHKEIDSSDDPEDPATQSLQWLLLLQAQRRGTTIATSPIVWPSGTSQLVTSWAGSATRNPRMQLGATSRGSVVVKALSPRERA